MRPPSTRVGPAAGGERSPSTRLGRGGSIAALLRPPPIITWSDARWLIFIALGLLFLFGVGAVIAASVSIGGTWGAVLLAAVCALLVALIALELRRFWLGVRH